MGGVAVLHPQDSIKHHLPRQRTIISSQMKPHGNPNPKANPSPTRSNRRKRSPEKNNNNKSRHAMVDDFPVKNMVMGQVKILKRGEEITEVKNPSDEKKTGDLVDLVLSPTTEQPKVVCSRQMRIRDFYAGSAIISSPPPSSLPLPAFFTKKNALGINSDASADLRRLLRLDLM